MKQKRMILAALCAAAMMALCLSGCGSSSAASTEASEVKTGIVVSIDAEKKTIAIADIGSSLSFDGSLPTGENGTPGNFTAEGRPENMPEGMELPQNGEGFDRTQLPEGFEQGQLPEGFDASQLPEGFDASNAPQMPEGGSFGGEAVDFSRISGESTTYSVTKNTVIKEADGTKISLSALDENALVQYTVSGDKLVTVTVTEMQPQSFFANGGKA